MVQSVNKPSGGFRRVQLQGHTALDRYLHPDYVQHNAFIPPAKAGLRGFIADLPDTTRYEPGAIIAEGDLVMVHGRHSGGFDKPLLGIDIFRFPCTSNARHG